MLASPSLDLLLVDLPDIIDIRDLTGDRAFYHLNAPAHRRAFADGVRGRNGFDTDDANARVVLAAVVHAVAQVAQPRLERRAVVLRDHAAVRHDARRPGYRGPAAVRGQEGHVHV